MADRKVNGMWTLAESAMKTAETFRTFSPGMPDLIPTGIHTIDDEVGGLSPGTIMILGAATGVGKSMVCLSAILGNQNRGVKTGYVSLEDAPDVFGCRTLARYSGVNAVAIRTKTFDGSQLTMLESGQQAIEQDAEDENAVLVAYEIGGSLERVCSAVAALAEEGCRVVYVDYIQKIKGHHDERKIEVSRAFGQLQAVTAEHGISMVVVSQVSRQMDENRIPGIRALKETGDLENEARMILMLGKDGPDVRGILRKSSFGGEGTQVYWHRKICGTLWETAGPPDDGESF